MMNKIYVVGGGPGNIDYIIPIGMKKIKEADIVVGGKRNLDSIDIKGKEIFIIKNNLNDVIDFIKKNYIDKKLVVILSGDPGFYGMLEYLKRYFDKEMLDVIPGISSIQYLFSKIGESWNDSFFCSLHGRDVDIVDIVKKNRKVGVLMDNKMKPEIVAQILLDAGIKEKTIYLGQDLSYKNEKIIVGTVYDISKITSNGLCAMVIIDGI
ncbi:MAG: precorrin-6y C5,15-methyltransferase (decarboxylating) subunit CbiE [Bacteroidales bacterium]|nr:precorrin-6y C5,15-methyltransferase (decarboxylating) subunit CbiE [Bacteroidales bacterium]